MTVSPQEKHDKHTHTICNKNEIDAKCLGKKKQSNKIAYLTNLGSVISLYTLYCHSIATHVSSEMLKLIENYRIKFFPSKHRKLLSSDGFVVPIIISFLSFSFHPTYHKKIYKSPLFEIPYILCDTEIQGFHNTDDDGISKVTKK